MECFCSWRRMICDPWEDSLVGCLYQGSGKMEQMMVVVVLVAAAAAAVVVIISAERTVGLLACWAAWRAREAAGRDLLAIHFLHHLPVAMSHLVLRDIQCTTSQKATTRVPVLRSMLHSLKRKLQHLSLVSFSMVFCLRRRSLRSPACAYSTPPTSPTIRTILWSNILNACRKDQRLVEQQID